MIKNTIKTLALFVAVAFAQTTVVPAVYADDDYSSIQKIQKIDKEKMKAKQEKEKARDAFKKAREAAKKAQWAAKHQSGSKPVTAPVVKPVTPAPVTPVPVVKPVTPAPVTPVPVVKPVTPAPVPTVPAIDGAALYSQKCAGCHGSSMRGKSASSTQSAISKNVGGMGYLSTLTAAQLTAISQY